MGKPNFWLLFFSLIILLISAAAIVYMIFHVVVTWKNYDLTLRFILLILKSGCD